MDHLVNCQRAADSCQFNQHYFSVSGAEEGGGLQQDPRIARGPASLFLFFFFRGDSGGDEDPICEVSGGASGEGANVKPRCDPGTISSQQKFICSSHNRSVAGVKCEQGKIIEWLVTTRGITHQINTIDWWGKIRSTRSRSASLLMMKPFPDSNQTHEVEVCSEKGDFEMSNGVKGTSFSFLALRLTDIQQGGSDCSRTALTVSRPPDPWRHRRKSRVKPAPG